MQAGKQNRNQFDIKNTSNFKLEGVRMKLNAKKILKSCKKKKIKKIIIKQTIGKKKKLPEKKKISLKDLRDLLGINT